MLSRMHLGAIAAVVVNDSCGLSRNENQYQKV